MQLANYPAVIAFGVATHRSQLKARTPLARNAGHSAARSVAKALRRPHRERKIRGSNPACDGIFPDRVIPVT